MPRSLLRGIWLPIIRTATIIFYKRMLTGEFVKNMLKIVQKKEIGK